MLDAKPLTAGIYGRVSTVKQDYAYQVRELQEFAKRSGWNVAEYLEKESAKAGSNRPALKRLMADAALRKFDVVLVWKIDRFGRSTGEFCQNTVTLDSLGIRFIACSQGIDTDKRNPLSKMLMHLLAVFAEFELDMIHERVQEGVDNYQKLYAAGKVGAGKQRESKSKRNLPLGGQTRIFRRELAAELKAGGMSMRAIGRQLKVPLTTLRRVLKAGRTA
jgi:DNA invertase Pin-like site-specific DNA recombinase